MAIDGIALVANKAQTIASRPVVHQSPQAVKVEAVSTAVVEAEASVPKVELPDIREQVASINRALQERRSNLSFSVDEGTGKTVVRVFRQSTGELIRQIPSEEVLAIAASLSRGDSITSLGVDEHS